MPFEAGDEVKVINSANPYAGNTGIVQSSDGSGVTVLVNLPQPRTGSGTVQVDFNEAELSVDLEEDVGEVEFDAEDDEDEDLNVSPPEAVNESPTA